MRTYSPFLLICLLFFSCSKDNNKTVISPKYFIDLDIAGKRFYSAIDKQNPSLTPGNSIQGINGTFLTVTTSSRYCDPPNGYCFTQKMELDDHQPGTYIPNTFTLEMKEGAIITEYTANRYGAGNGSVEVIINTYSKKSSGKPAIITGTINGTILRKAGSTLYYTEKLHGKFEFPLSD